MSQFAWWFVTRAATLVIALLVAVVKADPTVVTIASDAVADNVHTFADLATAWSTLIKDEPIDYVMDIHSGVYQIPSGNFTLTGSVRLVGNPPAKLVLPQDAVVNLTSTSGSWAFESLLLALEPDAEFWIYPEHHSSLRLSDVTVSGDDGSGFYIIADDSTIEVTSATWTETKLTLGAIGASTVDVNDVSIVSCSAPESLGYQPDRCFHPLFFVLDQASLRVEGASLLNNHGTFVYFAGDANVELKDLNLTDNSFPCHQISSGGGLFSISNANISGSMAVSGEGGMLFSDLGDSAMPATNSTWENVLIRKSSTLTGEDLFSILQFHHSAMPNTHILKNVTLEDNIVLQCMSIGGANTVVDMTNATETRNSCVHQIWQGPQVNITGMHLDGNDNMQGYMFFTAYDTSSVTFTELSVTNHKEQRAQFLGVDFGASVTIQNSRISGFWGYTGMFAIYGELHLKSCTLQDVELPTGVLVFYYSPGVFTTSTISDVYISNVTSGLVYIIDIIADHALVIDDSTFENNYGVISVAKNCALAVSSSTFTGSGPTGVIFAESSVHIQSSTFAQNFRNDTLEGGAIRFVPYMPSDQLVIVDSQFRSNVATFDGGALGLDVTTWSQVSMHGVTFENNKALRGGAIWQVNGAIGWDVEGAAFVDNTALSWQGDDMASGPAIISVEGVDRLELLSGGVLPDFDVHVVDARGQPFYSRPTEPFHVGVSFSDAASGQILGTISKTLLGGHITFQSLRVYAVPGEYNLVVKSQSKFYDQDRYQVLVPLTIRPCNQDGMEERVTRKDVKYPSCMQVTCSHSCPKAYGVCRHDFCYCFEGREGITCSDFASMRDSISISIASGPSSSLSARDLPDASELDDGSARDQVISEIANALQISETQVYFRSMNKTTGGLAFTFSVTDELGHFIEGHQLDSVRGALLSSDLPVAAIDLVSSMNHHASVSTRGVMTILVLAAMSMVITLIMMGGLVAHRHKPIVRASAVTFSMFILSAAFLACCLPYLYVGIPTDKSCLAQIWVGGIAFALAVGNIIAKNYRIYRIFNAGASATVKVLPDWKIMPISLAILIVELVIDAVWTKLAPLHPSLTDNGDRREWTCNTSSDANGPITMVATIYKILLLVLACILAYKTRDVGDQYSETRAISVASYTMLLSGAVVLPVVLLTDTGGVELEFYLKSVGLLLSLWVTIFVLFGTRLMAVYREYIGTFAWLSSSSSAAPGKGKGISKTSGSEAPKDVAVNENRPETSDNGYRCGVFVDGIFGGWRQGRVHMNAAGSILFLRLSEMERVNAVSFLRALGRGLYANAQKWAGSSLSPNVAIKCAYIQFFAEDENHLSMWIRNRSGTTHIRFLAKEHYEDISGKIKKHVKKAGLVSTVPRSSNKGA